MSTTLNRVISGGANLIVPEEVRITGDRYTSREFMGDHLVVILNWFERLERLTAAGKSP